VRSSLQLRRAKRSQRPAALAVFVAVAKQRSFRRAAGELGVTPSALSYSVRALETQHCRACVIALRAASCTSGSSSATAKSSKSKPNGPLTLSDLDLMIDAALSGAGLYVIEGAVRSLIASGVLVLDAWCPQYPGFFLYYPSRQRQPAVLKAFIEFLRAEQTA
jgi:DNA-binding transcriptional LysR family regulator